MGRVILLACAMLAACGPAAAAAHAAPRLSDEARERFTAGLAALRAGDWSAAARTFGEPGWSATPLGDYALLFHAESLVRLGDAGGAKAAAARAADPASEALVPSALLRAAEVLGEAGDDAGAAALYRRFLDRHADHAEAPRARYALGEALARAGQPYQAARAFHELWVQAPAAPQAAAAAQRLRELADGGVAAPTPTPRERVARAERLLSAGLADGAKREAEALAAEKVPAEILLRALRVVMEASRRVGRDDAAAAAVMRALQVAPAERRAPWLFELARLQQRRARELALKTLDRIVREHAKAPEAPAALLLKAKLLEAAGRLPEAEAVYQSLPAEYPDDEEAGAALWRLGWLAWFRGAHADAAGLWGRLATIRGGQHYREAAAYWIARAREERGEREAAQREYVRLLQDAPRSYYGVLASRRGARPLAAGAAASAPPVALPADPLEPLRGDPRWARADALRAVGLREFAEEEFEEIARHSSGEPRRLYALSAAYVQDARYHLALRILRRYFQAVARAGLAAAPRLFWEMFYPMGWRAELSDAASRWSVDPFLVAAVVREESSFHPQARSRVGARGLMQLMPETARPMAQARRMAFSGGDLLDDPAANLELGTAYLAGLLRQFGDPRLAVAAYNAGPARVREWWAARRSDDVEVWVEQIPYTETRGFVKRVMLSWDEYRRLYGSQP
jgi:soluble lytic murein transglycosylase